MVAAPAHYAADLAGVSAAEITNLAPGQIETARLRLHPACYLLPSEWATVPLWQAHQAGSGHGFPVTMRAASYGLVVRPLWQARVLPLSKGAHAALSALTSGQSLGAALDAAVDIDEKFDVSANVQRWLAHAVIVAVDRTN